MPEVEYREERFTKNRPRLNYCYLCDKNLGDNTSTDHVIPKALYPECSDHRPTLAVHKTCNNTKSFEDQWFALKIRQLAGTHERAESDLTALLEKATAEKERLRDDSPVDEIRNYRLMTTLFSEYTDSGSTIIDGKEVFILRRDSALGRDTRLFNYAETMCKGVLIRNGPEYIFPKPRVTWFIYDELKMSGTFMERIKPIIQLIDGTAGTRFHQAWDDQVAYYGSVIELQRTAYVFMEFYSRVGIFADFKDIKNRRLVGHSSTLSC